MMVVKADRCSGKTQLLCTLAAKLAEQNYKVCIVFSCKHLVQSGLQRVANLLPGAQSTDNRVRLLWGGGWVHCGKKCMKSESMGGIFIREFLHVEEQCSVANSTLINHFSMLNKVHLIHCHWNCRAQFLLGYIKLAEYFGSVG
jgi:hypothetical protein